MKIQQGSFSLLSSNDSFRHLTQESSLEIRRRIEGKEETFVFQSRSSATDVSLSRYGQTPASSEPADTYSRFPGRNGIGLAKGFEHAAPPGQQKFDRTGQAQALESAKSDDGTLDADTIADLRMLTFVRLMEQMFGLRFTITSDDLPEEKQVDMEKLRELGQQIEAAKASAEAAQSGQEAPAQNGQQITFQSRTLFHEEEHMRMSASGHVVTEDGRTLELSLDIGMSRTFQSESFISMTKGNLKDPLVINFDRPVVGLSDSLHFQFDLDADGTDETLPELLAGSGYLALDLNGDGVINSGNELFGARTGDGFDELAQYDDDGNGFIDENDAVFSQLRIWVPKGEGESELFALLDKDVGALYLKSQETPFALKQAEDNETQGYVRESGVFLQESGGLGSIQQIDLKV